MIDLHNYYNEVLTKFNFSISGYNNVEENINEFFNDFVSSSSLSNENHIDFISYAYSKLVDLKDWKLESTHTKGFFFNTFNERSLELLMVHEYYAFKNYISNINSKNFSELGKKLKLSNNEIKTAKDVSTSELAAKVFRKPIPYRVILSEDELIEVRFDKHLGVLTIKIPFIKIFNKKNDLSKIKNVLFNEFEKELVSQVIDGNVKDLKKILVERKDNIYTKIREKGYCFSTNLKLLNRSSIIKTIDILTSKLITFNSDTNNKLFFSKSKDIEKYFLKAFSKLLISHAFLSFLFDCWVENIPSVIDVDETNNDQRCLGTFIIGYNKSDELTNTERSLFRITSDRISANLASNAIESIYPEIKFNRARNKQVAFLDSFNKEVLLSGEENRLDHSNREINGNDLRNMNDFFLNNIYDLEDIGLSGFEKYVRKTFLLNNLIGKGIYTCFHRSDKKNVYGKLMKIYRIDKGTMKFNLDGIVEPTFNIGLINRILKSICEHSETKGIHIESKDENKFLLKIGFQKEVSLKNFSDSLQCISDYAKEKKGALGMVFINNWYDIMVMGNLEIGEVDSNGKFNDYINFSRDFNLKINDEGIKSLVLKNNDFKISEKKYKSLVYRFEVKSI